MIAAGVDSFVEVGPGKVLTGMLKRTDTSVSGYSTDDAEALEAITRAL